MSTIALILIVVFVLLLVMDVPIAVAIAMASFVAILAEGPDPTLVVAGRMTNGVNKFVLLAIPFFILSGHLMGCLLYTSPSPRDATLSRMPSSA